MARTLNEGLAEAPTFTPHRLAVAVNDAAVAPNTPVKAAGLDAKGWEDVVAEVQFAGTTTAATIEVTFFSELASQFLQQSPAVTFALTASRAIRFQADGRRFFLHVSGLAGAAPQVNIDVAGAPPHPEDSA